MRLMKKTHPPAKNTNCDSNITIESTMNDILCGFYSSYFDAQQQSAQQALLILSTQGTDEDSVSTSSFRS